ncbi:MAG: amino acid adenylation domain-containing protein [Candidatus Aminicenantes bacterium]|jgi:amino acid adenylation domain-containing protein
MKVKKMTGKINDNLLLTSSKFIKQKEYWIEKLSGEIRKTELLFSSQEEHGPDEYKKPVNFSIPIDLSGRLIAMGKQSDLSLYIILVTALKTLISRYISREDIIIISPLFADNIPSDPINQYLFIRDRIDKAETFRNLLFKVRQSILEAYGNQDYPSVKLYEYLYKTRQIQKNEPLSNISCLLKNIHGSNHGEISKSTLLFAFSRENNSLNGEIYYPGNGFETCFIENISRHFNSILAQAVRDINTTLSHICLLSEEEKRQLLLDFNRTESTYPFMKVIYELFREQAERSPDRICVNSQESVLADNHKKISLTYKELDRKADGLAWELIRRGTTRDSIIGLMTEPSIYMLIGILGILKAGGAYMPINPEFPPERINYMLMDSGALLFLTVTTLLSAKFPHNKSGVILLDTLDWHGRESDEPTVATCSSDLLYVIYTSGSTGKPKGVMLENRNLVNYVNWFGKEIRLTECDRTVLTSSFAFDLGYTTLYPPILYGVQLHIVPKEIYGTGEHLIHWIHRNEISYVKMTPSLFSIIVASPDFEAKNCISLRLVVLGGEEIIPGDIEKSHSLCPHIRIMNHYGPTEATIGCIARLVELNQWEAYIKTPTIGKPIYNTNAYIMDKYLNLLPVGIPGELYISGDGLARGYMNNPELTLEKFIKIEKLNNSFCEGIRAKRQAPSTMRLPLAGRGKKRIYKTGDRAKWMPDGNIQFLGRSDHQVKIRGYRIELGEIEDKLKNHESIKEAIAIIKTNNSTCKNICAYFIPDHQPAPSLSELRDYLLHYLPDYMIPSYFIQLEKWPLTLNGKVDRRALPDPEPGTNPDEYVAPGNETESKLVNIWSEILVLPKERIGVHSSFFQLGGHSLNITVLGARIHKVLNVKVPLAEIFKTPTIKGIARYIKSAVQDEFLSIKLTEKKEFYRLSSAQQRLYFLQQLDEKSTGYNISAAFFMESILEVTLLEEFFKKLIHRHESLRTSFLMIGDEPVQQINSEVQFKVECYDLAAQCAEEHGDQYPKSQEPRAKSIIYSFIRPFTLSRAPLIRVGLVHLPPLAGNQPTYAPAPSSLHDMFKKDHSPQRYILIVDMHHIISDGISTDVLMKNFMTLYNGEELPPPEISYKDFAEWQNRREERELIKKQQEFWQEEFRDQIPTLNLPLDYLRPVVWSFEGNSLHFEIDKQQTSALKDYALEQGASFFMVLLAIYMVFLAKLSGQEDIVVGIPVAGRRHADLERIIGMFVNTLALRNFPRGEHSSKEFLDKVKTRTIQAYANQDYPYEKLVESVVKGRDTGRNPLFDTMFVLKTKYASQSQVAGLKLETCGFENKISKFDLVFKAAEIEEQLFFTFEYSTKLFKQETIKKFIQYFKHLVTQVLAAPDEKISGLEIIGHREKQQVLFDFNDTSEAYPDGQTIYHLFEKQAERNPDLAAAVGGSPGRGNHLSITYKELNKRAHRLAHLLRKTGIKPGAITAIMVERSLEMLVGMLAILKAGGAYLPIDPAYPVARVLYMLKDSGANIVIAGGEGLRKIKSHVPRMIDICDDETFQSPGRMKHLDKFNPARAHPSEDLIYVIYTSGTTGKSKGVLVTHRGFVNLVNFHRQLFEEGPGERVSQVAGPAFDAMAFEVWPSLLSAATLFIIDDETRTNPGKMKTWLIDKQITISFQPTVMAEQLLMEEWPRQGVALRVLRTAGEQLTRYPSTHYPFRYYNLYGPTEDTVWTTWTEVKVIAAPAKQKLPSIGKPIANHRVYILGAGFKPQPVGIGGELCIAGAGIAVGYLNRPELTGERFCLRRPGGSFCKNRPLDPRKNFLLEVIDRDHLQLGNHASIQATIELSYHSPQHPIIQIPHYPVYRTGDLARWLPDGNIEFLGRCDNQVKLRGYRIEPGEIENHLAIHPNIKEAVVLVRETDIKDKCLCAYIVCKKTFDLSQLRGYLTGHLPLYMIPSHFINIDKIPLTPNGKLDRKSLPLPEVTVGDKYVAPGNDTEEKLVKIWSEVLNVDKDAISIDSNFFELGGHSLKATTMTSVVHKELNVKVPLTDIFRYQTVRELADYIKSTRKTTFMFLKPAEKKECYPMSSAQKPMFILQRMHKESICINSLMVIQLKGTLDRQRLQEAFRQLIQKHEIMRTSFHLIEEEYLQRIHPSVPFKLEYTEVESNEFNEEKAHKIIKKFVRPFDLKFTPLFRVAMVKIERERFLLMVALHHIIIDGTSMGIFLKDLMSLYESQQSHPLMIQLKDFAEWQEEFIKSGGMDSQKEHWLKVFEKDVPVLNLSTDFARPETMSLEGAFMNFEIDKRDTQALRALASREDATLFMVLLAVYNVLLSKDSGQEDIVVGSPVASRRHEETRQMIGIFSNLLALRNYPNKEKTFREFLTEVKENTLAAIENQDYPFEEIVKEVFACRERISTRNPLFDVAFALQNTPFPKIEVPGIKLEPFEFKKSRIIRYDLEFNGFEKGDRLFFRVGYRVKLFKEKTIKKLIDSFKNILKQGINNPDIKLSDIEVLSEEEKEQIIFGFNTEKEEYYDFQ